MLALPISSITRPSCSPWTLSTAFSTGSTRALAVSGSPRISNCTSALRPSAEMVFVTYGEVTAVTSPVDWTACITASTAERNSGEVAFTEGLSAWMSTVSPAGSFSPASSVICTARPTSPDS